SRLSGKPAHEVVAGHVEQAFGDLAAGDVGVHAAAQAFDLEGTLAEDVTRQTAAAGVDHLCRGDAGLRQPDHCCGDAGGEGFAGGAGDDEVAAEPSFLGGDRHSQTGRRLRHRLAYHFAERNVDRIELDAFDDGRVVCHLE